MNQNLKGKGGCPRKYGGRMEGSGMRSPAVSKMEADSRLDTMRLWFSIGNRKDEGFSMR